MDRNSLIVLVLFLLRLSLYLLWYDFYCYLLKHGAHCSYENFLQKLFLQNHTSLCVDAVDFSACGHQLYSARDLSVFLRHSAAIIYIFRRLKWRGENSIHVKGLRSVMQCNPYGVTGNNNICNDICIRHVCVGELMGQYVLNSSYCVIILKSSLQRLVCVRQP